MLLARVGREGTVGSDAHKALVHVNRGSDVERPSATMQSRSVQRRSVQVQHYMFHVRTLDWRVLVEAEACGGG